MIKLRPALRATFTGWAARRRARDQHAILQRVDAYTKEFDRAVKEAIARTREEAERAAADEPAPEMPWHPLTHQQRPVNPERYPAAVSLEDAVLRAIEDEKTGGIPLHLAPSGWSQR